MPIEPGQQVGRYRVVRLLAQGGMAEVYRAEQELAAGIFRPAALKVIRPEYTESPDFREMFLDEARTACTLSHPNIVHIYEVGEWEGLLYMAMELVPGETLANVGRTLRQSAERFTDEALLAIGIHTCSALEAVHALKLPGEGHLNLVHRDVSPHNLLLSSTGSLKLIDFGIAKAATNRNLTSPGVTKGKAGYFSPEQAMGKPLDGRSDLFSLGVALYKLAFGATPFDEHKTHHTRNTALVHGRWEPLRKVCPGLPPGLYDVVDRALQVRPEDRFRDAREMREALERVALESGVHVSQSSLMGYVDDDGEITASPSQKMAALRPPVKPITDPTKAAEPLAGRRRTERVLPQPAPSDGDRRTRLALIGISALSGLVIVAVLLLLFANPPPETPSASPRGPIGAGLDSARPERTPPPAPTEPVPHQPEELAVSVDELVISEQPKEPRAAAPVSPRPKPKLAPKPVGAELHEPSAIPKGEGRLRIRALPDATVTVGRESWGQTPLDRKLASGNYRLVISADGKKGLCEVRVLPDRVTRVIYDFSSEQCRTME